MEDTRIYIKLGAFIKTYEGAENFTSSLTTFIGQKLVIREICTNNNFFFRFHPKKVQ